MKEDWINCKLGDLLKLKNGFAFKSSKYKNEGVPVLRIGDIYDWKVNIENAKRIQENIEYDSYSVKKGDILIAMSGATTGKFGIYYYDEKAYQNQRVGNLVPHTKKHLDKKYIFYLLYSLKRDIEKDAYGGAQPNISATKIEGLNTTLAPLPIQRAIVTKIENLFTSLDKGIADLKKAQEQLKVYRQAVLKKAFEGHFTNRKEKEGELPEGWKWVKLGEVTLSMKNGIYKPSNFYGEQGIACLRMYNIDKGKILWFDIKRMVLEKQDIDEYSLIKGDLLVNRVNSRELVGKTATIKGFIEPVIYESKNIRVRLDLNRVNSDYINYWFLIKANEYFNSNAQQTVGMASINQKQLFNFEFPLPPSLAEQHAIVREIESRLSVCDKIEQSITETLEKSEALRQSILKKAFEGKLLSETEIEKCKQEADYEPASELFKKIKKEK